MLHLLSCTIPLGHPSAPAPSILYHASNLDWWFVSYMILYMFQCHSPKSSHPLPLPQSPKNVLYICVFFAVSHTGLSFSSVQFSCSVVSDSVWPHKRQPTRLPRPYDSPGKNIGVVCHFLLQCMKVKSEREFAQLCPTVRNPMDHSLSDFSVHGIFQARVLEWNACYNKCITSPSLMHDTGCLGLVHWDDPEGWYGEGGGRWVQDG